MKVKVNKKFRIPTPIFFLLATIVIMLLAPREKKFKYTYYEGKPWKYALLTAPFDFPIYKSEAQVQNEKDSVLNNYQLYFDLDKSVSTHEITRLEKDASAVNVSQRHIESLKQSLAKVYKSGIISIEDFDKINSTQSKQIKLKEKDKNVAETIDLISLYTPRKAYEQLIFDLPSSLNMSDISSLKLETYIQSNISFDEGTSRKAKDELMQHISLVDGMVQLGEKIVDRGEIIDKKVFHILYSFERVSDEWGGTQMTSNWLQVGRLILLSCFMFILMAYFSFFRGRVYSNRKELFFVLILVVSFVSLTCVSVSYNLFNVYIIPFAISAILVRTFIDSRTATIVHLVIIFISSLMVTFPIEFLFVQIAVGFMCVISLRDLTERSQVVRSSLMALLTYVIAYIGVVLWQDGDIMQVSWRTLISFGINFIFVMFSYLLIYMCERLFGFISGVSMVELSNINKPLLQKLSETAPGTFQHSMQVSNLASAAATKIGANASLVRTGALYHDIGKMTTPAFFTENQTQGYNPHKTLSYTDSARIIIGHVAEGVRIAKLYQLPNQIIDFIATHHGESKARFFYNSYVNEHPDEIIDESIFTYPGPNPFSKETGILMLADTIEAASRSLDEYTEESLSALINKLINTIVSEGLLRNTPLTFRDIEDIKAVFCEKLQMVYHTRVSYPELKEQPEE